MSKGKLVKAPGKNALKIKRTIVNVLRKRMKELGLQPHELAEKAELPTDTVHKVLDPDNTEVQYAHISRTAHVMGLKIKMNLNYASGDKHTITLGADEVKDPCLLARATPDIVAEINNLGPGFYWAQVNCIKMVIHVIFTDRGMYKSHYFQVPGREGMHPLDKIQVLGPKITVPDEIKLI